MLILFVINCIFYKLLKKKDEEYISTIIINISFLQFVSRLKYAI